MYEFAWSAVWQALGSLVGAVAVSTAVVALARATRVCEQLDDGTGDVEGFYICVLGTIYAVFLALMVYSVWTRYDNGVDVADREAGAVCDLYRVAHALPAPASTKIQRNCETYAVAIVNQEWPAMADDGESAEASAALDGIWAEVYRVDLHGVGSATIRDQLTDRVITLSAVRRERLLQAKMKLPPVMWGLLLFGATVNVTFSALFGVDKFSSHATKTGALALLIAAALFTTRALDRPFVGLVHVASRPYLVALDRLGRYEAVPVSRPPSP